MTDFAQPNTIVIRERPYLLTELSGSAVHLTPAADPGEPARSIAHEIAVLRNPAYDARALIRRYWSLRTLCGRRDWRMAPTEAGSAVVVAWRVEAAFAPTCHSCLRIVGRDLNGTQPDDRLGWNVVRCVEAIAEHGCVMVYDVPGDQMDHLRRRVRTEARSLRWRFQSVVIDNRLYCHSETARRPERQEALARERMEMIMSSLDADAVVERDPPWRFPWS
jgi:hypothetical protein